MIYSASLLVGILVMVPFDGYTNQKIVVQIGASKTAINIQDFVKQYNVSDSITEVYLGGWYQYYVGNFETIKQATDYSIEIVEKTKLPMAYPRIIEVADSIQQQTQISDSVPITDTIIPLEDSIKTTIIKPQNIPETSVKNKRQVALNKNNYLLLNLIGEEKALQIKNNLIIYGDKHFPFLLNRFYRRVVEKIFVYPIILLLILLILFFILNVIFVVLVLYYSNKSKNRKERYIKVYRTMYEEVLLSYLFGEIDWGKVLVKLKKISRPLNKKIVSTILFNFQDNLKGGMDDQIPEIFVKLGLHKSALKAAKSAMYYKKVQGMRDLTYLYSKGALEIIPDYLNDSNDLVRAEAQTSYIRLHEDKPFEFLKTLTSPFTRWTQLTAFHLFRLHQLPVPSFVDYLDSEHPNVRNFCLQMISFFQQLENASEIFNLLKSPVELTRYLCIKAINDLRLYDGKELIKNIYSDETEKNKLEIIKVFRTIGDENDFEFLEGIIQTDSISPKTEACRSMYYMNNTARERLEDLNLSFEKKLAPFIAHVTDLRN